MHKNTKQTYQHPAGLQEKLHIKYVFFIKQTKKNESTNLRMQLSCFLPPIKKQKPKKNKQNRNVTLQVVPAPAFIVSRPARHSRSLLSLRARASPASLAPHFSCLSSDVSPRLFVRALIPWSDDITASSQPIRGRAGRERRESLNTLCLQRVFAWDKREAVRLVRTSGGRSQIRSATSGIEVWVNSGGSFIFQMLL